VTFKQSETALYNKSLTIMKHASVSNMMKRSASTNLFPDCHVGNTENEAKAAKKHKVQRYSTVDKAGLADVDLEHIQSILSTEATSKKQSAYDAHAEVEQRKLEDKISKMKEEICQIELENRKCNFMTTNRQNDIKKRVQLIESDLENSRNLSNVWFCVDMDSFYCSCEAVGNPALVGKPFVVSNSLIISTSSYEARKFGVRSGMPLFQAKLLCPELIVIPVNMEKYKKVSAITQKIFAEYDPFFTSHSLDEALLNLTPFLVQKSIGGDVAKNTEMIENCAKEIQNRVLQATHCTCSIGVAPNSSLAKIASNINKPNGIFQLQPNKETILEFSHKLAIRKVSGIGPVDEAILQNAFNITTVADLYHQRHILFQVLKNERKVTNYINAALGFPHSPSSPAISAENRKPQNSFSRERTSLVSNVQEAITIGRKLTEEVVCDVEESHKNHHDVKVRTITLKIDDTSFHTRSTSAPLKDPIPLKLDSIWKEVKQLIEQEFCKISKTRLIGLKLSNLTYLAESCPPENSIAKFFLPSTSSTRTPYPRKRKIDEKPKDI